MAKKIFFVIITIILSGFSCFFAADTDDLGRLFFDKAVSEYLSGSRDQAIDSLEKSLKYMPANNEAKKILGRLLVQRAGDSFYNNDIEKSFIDIRYAKQLLPSDPRVDRLYNFIKTAFEERFKPAAGKEQKEMVQIMTGAYLEEKPAAIRSVQTKEDLTYIIAAFASGVLILFLAVLMAFDRLYKIREHDMYMQRVELERVKWALQGKNANCPKPDPAFSGSSVFASLSKAPPEMERLLKNSSVTVRAKGLIILEAEMLLNENKKNIALKMLEPILDDEDPIIAANAARAYCGGNMQKGMSVLEKMSNSDRPQKTAALYSMGWVPSERSVRLLMKSAQSKDGKISLAAVKSLMQIRKTRYNGVPKTLAESADKLLSIMVIKGG